MAEPQVAVDNYDDDLPGEAPPATSPQRDTNGRFLPRTEKAPDPVAPLEPTPEVQPNKYTHSPLLLSLASRYGIEAEQMSPEQLEQSLTLADKLSQRWQSQQTQQPQPQVQQPAPQPQAKPEDELLNPDDFEEFDPKFKKLVGLFNNQVKKNQALEAQLSGVTGEVHKHANMTAAQVVDSHFASLSPQHKALFGANNLGSLSNDEFERRKDILNAVGMHPNDPNFTAKFRQVVSRLYPQTQKAPDAPPPVAEEAWDAASLATPSGRRAPDKPLSRREVLERAYAKSRGEPVNGLVRHVPDDDDLPD